MAASIGDYLARVQWAQQWAATESDRTDKNVYLSDFAKKEAQDAIAANLHDSVTSAVHGLFGKIGATGLEGGDFWAERETLQARLREARDAADTMDPARLSNTYRRIPAVVSRAANLHELQEWYDSADSYERRGLQDLAGEAMTPRLRMESQAGGFLAQLESDRRAGLTTPELQEAEQDAADHERTGYEAHQELMRALPQNGAITFDPATRALRAVAVGYRIEDASRTDSPIRYTVEKQAGSETVYWPTSSPGQHGGEPNA